MGEKWFDKKNRFHETLRKLLRSALCIFGSNLVVFPQVIKLIKVRAPPDRNQRRIALRSSPDLPNARPARLEVMAAVSEKSGYGK